MRRWNLGLSDPQSLTIAADSRLAALDYANDQIWELVLIHGDPAAIVLQTTYGLRARNMRIFPQFTEAHQIISDPAQFETPPSVHKFYPNYIELSYSPFIGIDVRMEYWALDCQTMAGRIRVTNNGVTNRKIQMDLISLLNPAGDGETMLPEQMEAVTILRGKTSKLSPVLFITGGAKGISSPYPALSHEMEFVPASHRQFTWVLASLPEREESFRHARQTATRNWEAEIAKIEITNANQVEIFTGDPDWDAAFALGQKAAYTLLHDPTEHLRHTSFVSTRQPDQGYSQSGGGGDYSHLWNGQTAIDAWYLSQLLLPGGEEIAKGILLNFLETQEANGRIDWKPGLAGQRAKMLATPVLVSLAWRIYQHTQEKGFLEQIFPFLLDFIHAWFDERQDRDGDGIPEWDNAIQSGYEDNPAFAYWHSWAQGADISLVECPDLCAYLYKESQLLKKIAKELKREESASVLDAFCDNLSSALENSWDARRASYLYWDRETHQSHAGEVLGERKGPGELFLDIVFGLPKRLLLHFDAGDEIPLQAAVTIHGTLPNGQHRVERIGREQIRWTQGQGTVTLGTLYADLEHLQVEGMPEDATTSVHLIDYLMQDQTLLTPLWAEIPEPEMAKKIIDRKINIPTQFYRLYGIPASQKPPKDPDAITTECVWLPWNVMVGEGLIHYGAREETIDLVTRTMNGIVENLKREHSFRKHYHADRSQGIGERNALAGLPPMGLFLTSLGVRIISPWKVFLHGFNKYPWPIRLKYRGLVIECNLADTLITFPDGQQVVIDDPNPCIIEGKSREENA